MRTYRPSTCGTAGLVLAAAITAVMPQQSAVAQQSATALRAARQVEGAGRCEQLMGQKFGHATVTQATYIPSGQALGAAGPLGAFKAPAAFCRVQARITPAPGSEITSEVWLPDAWNGKLYGTGGSGYDGGLFAAPITLSKVVRLGYVGAAPDAGHPQAGGANWALGHREKVID